MYPEHIVQTGRGQTHAGARAAMPPPRPCRREARALSPKPPLCLSSPGSQRGKSCALAVQARWAPLARVVGRRWSDHSHSRDRALRAHAQSRAARRRRALSSESVAECHTGGAGSSRRARARERRRLPRTRPRTLVARLRAAARSTWWESGSTTQRSCVAVAPHLGHVFTEGAATHAGAACTAAKWR